MARGKTRFALAALAAPGMLWAQQGGNGPVEIGIAAAIVGDVRISSAAAPKERAVVSKQRISWGNIVHTLKESELHILLLDRSNFTLGANTRMTIDRFVYNPGQNRSFLIRMFEGAFRFISGAKAGNNSGTIESPVGTIGIRGTALDGVIGKDAVRIAESEPGVGKSVKSDKDKATLIVLRGPGRATESGLTIGAADVTAAGRTVTLDQPELAAYIPRPGAPPIGPFRLTAAGLSEVQDLLAPTVARANKGNNNMLGKILGGVVAAGVAGAVLSDGGKGGGQAPQGKANGVPAPVNNPNNQSIPGRKP